MEEKTELQQLAEKILVSHKEASPRLQEKDVTKLAESYKQFLSDHKTEREVVSYLREQAKKAGYADLGKATSVEKGKPYYMAVGDKNFALIRFGGLHKVHIVASHMDSPCLHLKPYPVVESHKAALFKTHYYGGVKKYQWLSLPLALHGVAHTTDGKRVDISIGEKDNEPCFTIPDLLPHLARDQMEKTGKKLVEGEQLNPLMQITGVEDDAVKEKVKLAAMKYLYDTYGITESDLVSAELLFVPAGKARDSGFTGDMIAGYGHDDRSSVFASCQAFLDAKDSDCTQICLFYDKEEIGSYGKTGAQNMFMPSLIELLIDLSQSDLRPSQVWGNMNVLSADVTVAMNPNFPEANDSTNASFLGYGVSIEKYGGGGGKYSTSDADAEFMHALTSLYDKQDVPWQTGELGKIDIGGGGTIAMFLAKYGANVVDMGVPVLGMHSPFELLSKADLYSAYKGYKVFMENPL